MDILQIIDPTTLTLFSPSYSKALDYTTKRGEKKGVIKVHTIIHANEGVPSDIKFTSVTINDSFMLNPLHLSKGYILVMD